MRPRTLRTASRLASQRSRWTALRACAAAGDECGALKGNPRPVAEKHERPLVLKEGRLGVEVTTAERERVGCGQVWEVGL